MSFLEENWFNIVQSVGIIASLLFAAIQIRLQSKIGRISNSLLVTQYHREIWSTTLSDESLQRLFAEDRDLDREPISDSERTFLNIVFLHLSVVLKAMDAKAIHPVEGLERDVRDLLSYPAPREVWRQIAEFQDTHLRQFINRVYLPPVAKTGIAARLKGRFSAWPADRQPH